MTEITAQSIDAALRKQLDAINTSVESRETGTVVQIGDGIARIDGLKGAMSGELLEFVASDGRIVSGLVQNLEEDEVGAVLLGDVNLDGKVTPTDYLLLKRQLVVEDCLPDAGKQRADINGDGALTPTDYLLLKRMILGL